MNEVRKTYILRIVVIATSLQYLVPLYPAKFTESPNTFFYGVIPQVAAQHIYGGRGQYFIFILLNLPTIIFFCFSWNQIKANHNPESQNRQLFIYYLSLLISLCTLTYFGTDKNLFGHSYEDSALAWFGLKFYNRWWFQAGDNGSEIIYTLLILLKIVIIIFPIFLKSNKIDLLSNTDTRVEINDSLTNTTEFNSGVIYCVRCGNKGSVEFKFCAQCGLDLPSDEVLQENQVLENYEEDQTSTIKGLLVATSLVIVTMVIGIFLFMQKSDNAISDGVSDTTSENCQNACLAAVLSSDSGINVSANSGSNQSANSESDSSQAIFSTGPEKDLDSEGHSVLCGELGGGSDLISCMFSYYVRNTSNVPQEFDGDLFALTSDGKVFKADSEIPRYSHDQLNPSERKSRLGKFLFPKGTVVKELFRASSATDLPFYEIIFNVKVS